MQKSGEEDWKRKIPKYNKKSICGENDPVLESLAATLEANNKNNNTGTPIIRNNGEGVISGKWH